MKHRNRHYPLLISAFDLRLATGMAEFADIYNLDILHVHYAIPHSFSALLRSRCSAAQLKAIAQAWLL